MTTNLWLSLAITPMSLLAMVMTGHKNRWGWMLVVGAQVLGIWLTLRTGSYFLLINGALAIMIGLRNFKDWSA